MFYVINRKLDSIDHFDLSKDAEDLITTFLREGNSAKDIIVIKGERFNISCALDPKVEEE